ncbi:MAG: hypothetical protein HDR83_09385 [Bacteroides sp.]|nr:hypothetical protein [Bacteroides sp.]
MKSEPFTSSPSAYLRYTMLVWMMSRGWLLFIPLFVSVALASVLGDIRWAIVAVAYMLVCVPMILTPVALKYILTPSARRQLALKSVEIDPDRNIAIRYYDRNSDDDALIPGEGEIISASEVKAIFHFRRHTVIWLDKPDIQLILIPD